MRHFLKISKHLGSFPHLVQGAGGNTSVKNSGKLTIKASGVFLKNVARSHGFITCSYAPLQKYLNKISKPNRKMEIEFDNLVEKQMHIKQSFGIPSIETSFHIVIPSKYIFHTHSVYTNIFNCMKNGEKYLSQILKEVPFYFLPYYNPGLSLGVALDKVFKKKKSLPKVILLENHGIITHGNDAKETLKLSKLVDKLIIAYLKKRKAYKPFKVAVKSASLSRHLFPDSAVYSQIDFSKLSREKQRVYYEICSAHNYILNSIKALKEKPVFLKSKDISYIINMTKEKYRINKIKHS